MATAVVLCTGRKCPASPGPLSMGALRHGQRGPLVPWKCCEVFCRSVNQLFMRHFRNFWRVGVVYLVVLACVLTATSKKNKRSSTFFWRTKRAPPNKILATPTNLPTPRKNPAGAHAVEDLRWIRTPALPGLAQWTKSRARCGPWTALMSKFLYVSIS